MIVPTSKKRKKKDGKEGKKKVKFVDDDSSSSSASRHSTWANLPDIVLFKVFKYVVTTDGALPFLCR